jgi:DNA-binding GntR family transcriptional regulator
MLALDTLDILQVLDYRKIVERGILSLVVKRAGNAEIEELEYAFRAMVEHVERTIRRLKFKRGGDRKSRVGRKADGKA